MNEAQHRLVTDLLVGRLSTHDFVEQFGVDPTTDRQFVRLGLERALIDRSSDDVSALLALAFRFDLSASWAPLLCRLLQEDWHQSHEDLASALQDLRDPTTVDGLFAATCVEHAYLAFDDARALAVKCIWALHDIGTDAARSHLETLARFDVEVIRHAAGERLDALATRDPGAPPAAYRRARDAHVRRD